MLRLTAETEAMETSRRDLEEKAFKITREISDLAHQADCVQKDIEAFSVALDAEKTAFQSKQTRLTSLKKERDAINARLMDLTGREARHQHVFQHASSSRETLKRRLKRADEEEHTARNALIESEKTETAARKEMPRNFTRTRLPGWQHVRISRNSDFRRRTKSWVNRSN